MFDPQAKEPPPTEVRRSPMQTRTPVHSAEGGRAARMDGTCRAYRQAGAICLCAQLTIAAVTELYPLLMQAAWQAMLLQLVPLAALALVWNAVGGVTLDRANGGKARRRSVGKGVGKAKASPARDWLMLCACALLAPCLIIDAARLLGSLTALCDTAMLPEWPSAAVAIVFAVTAWLCAALGKERGTVYGAAQWRWLLAVLLAIGTVWLGVKPGLDSLWPLLGKGLGDTATAALRTAGAGWTAALLFLLPSGTASKGADAEAERAPLSGDDGADAPSRQAAPTLKAAPTKRAPSLRPASPMKAAWLPLACGWGAAMLLALWMCLCLPLRSADNAAQWMALPQLSPSAVRTEASFAGLLLLLVCALMATAGFAERIGAGLGLARSVCAAAVLALGCAVALWPQARAVADAVAPYRWAAALAAGAALLVRRRR